MPRSRAAHRRSDMLRRALACAVAVLWCSCAASTSGGRAVQPSPGLDTAVTASPVATRTAGAISLAAIQRVDPRVGFVSAWAGGGPVLAETGDAGATWRRVPIPASRVTSLRFIDEQVGWAGGFVERDAPQLACRQAAPAGGARPCRGVVLRTDDGGRSWRETLSVATDGVQGDPISQLQAVDGEHAWALTLAPPPCPRECPTQLRRTMDGGRTWTTLLEGRIAMVRFAGADRGWLALVSSTGAVDVRTTDDGGTTWQDGLRTTGQVIGLDAATSQTAWVMTRDGASCTASSCSGYDLFRTVDGGRHWSSLGNPKSGAGGCGFGHLAGPLFASAARGWLALNLGAGGAQGGPGGLLRTEDGGTSWRCAGTPPNTSMVSAADPLHVWAAGQDRVTGTSTLFATEDGSASWRTVDLSSLR